LQQWETEHLQSNPNAGRLEAYHPDLRVSQHTKPFYLGYLT
jgi:hypothetical protein